MGELITVVIPVYNVEEYLERCFNSVRNQSYKQLDIILVDDGSTDACPEICDNFAKIDKRVTALHKTNGGLADARNVGIENAKGEYITFIDSDDYISPYYVENLYSAMKTNEVDLSVSMFENVSDNLPPKSKPSNSLINTFVCDDKECLKRMLLQQGVETSAPGKLYKKELIGELRFPKGKLFEDVMFTTTMISRAKRIALINNVDYYYYQRNGSIQYQQFSKRKMDRIAHSRQMKDFIIENYPDLKTAAITRYFGSLCIILIQIPKGYYNEERAFIKAEIIKYRRIVICNKEARAKNRVAAILSYFGETTLKYVYKKTQLRGRYL